MALLTEDEDQKYGFLMRTNHSTVTVRLKYVLCNNGVCVLKRPLATWMCILAHMLPSVLRCSFKPQADGQEVKTLASSLSVPSLVEAFRC